MHAKLQDIFDFLRENTTGEHYDASQSMAEQFKSTGYLSDKQWNYLRGIIQSTIRTLKCIDEFEDTLGDYLRSGEGKAVMKIVNL